MKKNRFKIIIILLFIVGAVWALLPTYTAQSLKAKLDSFGSSAADSASRVKFLTQNREDMKNANAKAIKLGLDLQGGIYVTMEVDVLKYIEEQATQKDDLFNQVLTATAAEEARSEDPVVNIFVQKFKDIAAPKGKALANYFVFNEVRTGDDKEIQAALQKGADEAVDRAVQIIRNRIDQFGLTEPTIQKQGSRRIILELPGVGDPSQIHQLLEGTAQLEFKTLKDPRIVQQIVERVDKFLAKDSSAVAQTAAQAILKDSAKTSATTATANKAADTTSKKMAATAAKADSTATAAATPKMSSEDSARHADSLAYAGLTPEQRTAKLKREKPLSFLLFKSIDKNGNVYVTDDERNQINALLARKEVKALVSDEMSVSFSRPFPAQNGQSIYMVYFLNATPELTGKVITDAGTDVSQQDGRPEVSMQMDDDGAKEWKRITTQNVHRQIAIVLDNVVYSAPVVNGPIPNGRSSISGSGDMAEANLLKIVLKAGALPAPVKIIQEQVVGPSLGADSISKGLWSVIMGLVVVVLFMLVYYVTGGVIADIAVVINVLFTLAVLATFGATLTLPGMAGLVLTVGIAVDANVLIYERIREELALGKSLARALDDGYRRAFAPIFDGHLTAFFSGVILYAFGTGTVQGFAVTLMIGIAASLFTAIVITRVIFDILVEKNPGMVKFG